MFESFKEFCTQLLAPIAPALKTLDLEAYDVPMIFVGAVLFYLFWSVMERAVFKPFLELHEAREAATVGSVDSAAAVNREADQIVALYEEQITSARISAMQQKLGVLGQTKDQAAKVVAEADAQAKSYVTKARTELAQRIKGLKDQALRDTDSFSAAIVEKLKREPTAPRVH